MKPAISTDWKTKALPSKRATIQLDRKFSLQEMKRIRNGLVPMEMGDDWFVYNKNDDLHFHRSWTGFCIYIVHFVAENDGFKMVQALANRNPKQYDETSDTRDAEDISYLVDVLLLGRERPYEKGTLMSLLMQKHVDDGGIPGLNELLNEWIDAQAFYIEKMEREDCPWLYNETAVTGFLAGAAWRLGGVGLQEYRTTKKGHPKKDPWTGRCDLYTYVGNTAFIFEAKLCLTNIGLRTDLSLVRITQKLKEATTDSKVHSASDGIRLGVCFAVPFYAKSRHSSSEQIIRNWCTEISKVKSTAIAWYFPEEIESFPKRWNCVFPGIVAFIRRV